MYLGKMVEMARGEDLFHQPLHPYTQTLLQAIPRFPLGRSEKPSLKEEFRPGGTVKGCLFQSRCPHSEEKCQTEEPLLMDHGEEHLVACHFVS